MASLSSQVCHGHGLDARGAGDKRTVSAETVKAERVLTGRCQSRPSARANSGRQLTEVGTQLRRKDEHAVQIPHYPNMAGEGGGSCKRLPLVIGHAEQYAWSTQAAVSCGKWEE